MLELILALILSSSPTLPSTKGAVFTFDDGPTKHTVKILDVLKKHKIKAVFCMPAVNLYRKGALKIAKRAIKEGHTICNHSWNHPNFSKLSKYQQERQFIRSQRTFKKLLGFKPKYFRPPFGVITRHMWFLIRYNKMKMLYWHIDSSDWSPKTTRYIMYHRVIRLWKRRHRVRKKKGKPDIIIFHDTNWRTSSTIEKIIIRIKKGYKPKKASYR